MTSPSKKHHNHYSNRPMSGNGWFEFAMEEASKLKPETNRKKTENHQDGMLGKVDPAHGRWNIRYARVFADKAYRSQTAAENCATFIQDDEELVRAIRNELGGVLEITISKSPYYNPKIVNTLVSIGNTAPPTTALMIAERKFLGPARLQIEASCAHLGRQELLSACIRFLQTEEIRQKVERYAAKYGTPRDLSRRQAARAYNDFSLNHPFFNYAIRSVFPLAKALVDTFKSSSMTGSSGKVDTEGLLKELRSIFPAWKYLTNLNRRLTGDNNWLTHKVTFGHVLIEHSSVELVEEYLRQGGDVNSGGPHWTLLQAAVKMHTFDSRMNKIPFLLLEHGAYITWPTGEHCSALRTAASHGKWMLLEKLLVRGLSSGAWKIANDLNFIMDIIDRQGGINPGEGFSDLPAPERIAMYAKRQVIRIIEDQVRRDELVIRKHL
ncbi:hypothetical protein PENDEC_c002G01089 [Penicillium decumbens]|uniref:Clr5 domain-containing protein n=1 Tax=Penicillium decumbens TaxID=69771 RepID=A0A1V6PKB9_PENDC|nr:hypothetical protein PENDEC_c002G01089 [Penicillium decumbens]